ncbi:hypothetical protein E2C01_095385 [Portunus trituberculatus]|uniref:Uncharacterized protein n=1 Tax=Portunus trituberculatus TaxID=210409 RepID=A0A5B7K432_PORTR|nr:hypothetical protein [Portunus trituberculatus]
MCPQRNVLWLSTSVSGMYTVRSSLPGYSFSSHLTVFP